MTAGLRVACVIITGATLVAMAPPPLHAAADKLRKAPSISLKTLDGRSAKLADHKGRVVVVDFWASWCGQCKETFPQLDALAVEMKQRGVDVLAVSEDEKRKDLDAFLANMRPSIDVLIDAQGDAAAAFDVTAIPSLFVIDQDGMIRFAHRNYGADVIDAVKEEVGSIITRSLK